MISRSSNYTLKTILYKSAKHQRLVGCADILIRNE